MSPAFFGILGYGCTSAAGSSATGLWTSLSSGIVPNAMTWSDVSTARSSREILGKHLLASWKEAFNGVSPTAQKRLRLGENIGVILASTKGVIDDLVWSAQPSLERDTLSPLIDDFLLASELRARRRTCVSNACTSGLSALFLAQHWLKHGGLTDVIILSADRAGQFVQKGFATLRVLTPDQTRPFSAQRSGFKIGDASACLILSLSQDESHFRLAGVSIDGEGHAVTRPSQSGESLERACRRLPLADGAPDLVIAHGTSTQINDATEDRVYTRVFDGAQKPLITATKWCTGHTLGASSALDVIAACEVLKHERAFAMATTEDIDAAFTNRYAYRGANLNGRFRRVMVSSLGFGGIHAAALIERTP